jgi:all-trans-retinol dehydrogenase (NAD+)
VTGAASGIGQAVAARLAIDYANVIGCDLPGADFTETARRVEANGGRFTGLECNVAIHENVERLRGAIESMGALHLLVNNVGVPTSGPFDAMPFAVWEASIAINLVSTLQVTHALLPLLRRSAPAAIVNISSVAGKFGTEGLAAYAAAKHGLVGFSSSLRAELAPADIGVSWVCPVFVQTAFLKGFQPPPLTPLLTPETVAEAVARAARDNPGEVFVPKSHRWLSSVLPALFPRWSRVVAAKWKLGGNWMELRRGPGYRSEETLP